MRGDQPQQPEEPGGGRSPAGGPTEAGRGSADAIARSGRQAPGSPADTALGSGGSDGSCMHLSVAVFDATDAEKWRGKTLQFFQVSMLSQGYQNWEQIQHGYMSERHEASSAKAQGVQKISMHTVTLKRPGDEHTHHHLTM
eukprot:336442-Chlamydomonas_euryale.AAC.5